MFFLDCKVINYHMFSTMNNFFFREFSHVPTLEKFPQVTISSLLTANHDNILL